MKVFTFILMAIVAVALLFFGGLIVYLIYSDLDRRKADKRRPD